MKKTFLLALALAATVPAPVHAASWIPDHIVIVIEENLSPRHIVPELPYLTALLRENAYFTNSHGVDHPSQPNYLALFSGSTQGTGSNRNPDGSNLFVGGRTVVGTDAPVKGTPLTTPNLGAALIRAGRSFVGYSEDLPRQGFIGNAFVGPPGSGIDYQRKHNPWVNWQALRDEAIGENQLSSQTNLPFDAFPTDEDGFARLPTIAIVVPNEINDGHGSAAAAAGTNVVKAMDDWLRAHIEAYRKWAMRHNSLLIITWDEDENEYIPIKDASGRLVAKQYLNLIPTIMAGERVIPGAYGERIDHYAVLHTLENFYGIAPFTQADVKAPIIADAFRLK